MEPTELDIILHPAKLVITKQSLKLVQTRNGKHQFEMYQLIGDVIGFEFFRQPPSPPVPSSDGGNYAGLLFFGALFASLAYGARATGWSNVDFVLPAFISLFCLVVVGGRLFTSTPQPGLDYGLRIKLATAPDKLLLCANPKDVRGAISAIYAFIHSGAYVSYVEVRSEIFSMNTQVQRHTP